MNECCFRKWTPAVEMKGVQQFIGDAKNPSADRAVYTSTQAKHNLKLYIFLCSCDFRLPMKAAVHRLNTAKNSALLTQVTFACDDGVTMGTVELCHILGVFLQDVHLHGAALRETRVTDVALVWLLACDAEERRQSVSQRGNRIV